MILIEIALTVAAYRKGWKGWAFLPVGVTLAMGFVLGAMLAAGGKTLQDVGGAIVIPDLLAMIALAVMSARAPQDSPAVTRSEVRAISA
jgi:hypothetical protein